MFQWNTSAISKLRFLHLHKCRSLDPTLSFDQFLDALASCAELEELRLHRFISTINNSVPVGYDREISLPQLRKLVVGDVPAHTALFLSTLALPISIELRVIGYIDSLVLDDEFHLFRWLLPTDRAQLLILRSVTKVEFHGYDESFYASGALPSGGSIKLVLRSHLDDVDFELYTERGITEVADIFHHSPVTDLHVNCAPDTVDDPEVWAILLASFSRVRNLYVLPGQIMRPIWHALGGRSYLMHPSANHKVLMCPDLRSLTIDYLRWDQETMDYILGSLVRRHIRGLPKLDYLNLAFTYALEPDRRDVVVSETEIMIPFYEKLLATYTAEFEWGLS